MFKKLTKEGEDFIRRICTINGNKSLSGKLSKPLPFSEPETSPDKIWECNIIYNGNKIENSTVLASALIFWYNRYAEKYQMDANILAAQSYVESKYIMWNYLLDDTSSGVSNFTMEMVFEIIVNNLGQTISTSVQENIDKITKDLINPKSINSYLVKSNTPMDARKNRPIIHQNIIDNPEIIIDAQYRYLKKLMESCNGLASTSLFCYNTGISHAAKTYSLAIENCKNSKVKKCDYLRGVNYVLNVFQVLGDKDNKITNEKKTTLIEKPKGYYFGYEHLFKYKDSKNNEYNQLYYTNPNFQPFEANIAESKEFGIVPTFGSDLVSEELSREPKYKFIYFPENQYIRERTEKRQIVLHHTVSGDNIGGDVNWWKSKGERIATSFIIGRNGEIIQLFLTNYWAYHLGLPTNNNLSLNKHSIGIELSSWGGLIEKDGLWYPARTDGDTQKLVPNTRVKPIENVVQYKSPEYPKGFHGFFGFERYTQEQINATRKVIMAISKKFAGIDLKYVNDIYGGNMWGVFDTTTNRWKVDENAMEGKSGIWTHVSYRPDKSDCHPQQELIDMLKSL